MKNRDIKMRRTIKASKVRKHDVIELDGQRIRCDRVGRDHGRVKLTTIPNGRRPTRHIRLHVGKHVDLVRR